MRVVIVSRVWRWRIGRFRAAKLNLCIPLLKLEKSIRCTNVMLMLGELNGAQHRRHLGKVIDMLSAT